MRKAILVGININNLDSTTESLAELKDLAEANEIETLEMVIQNLSNPTPNYYIGKGKALEIKNDAVSLEADVIIFDDELSPTQLRNLSNLIDIEIIDRTMVILDIFKRRASSDISKLQVELAELRYKLPRLIGSYDSLSRQKSGVGSKGAGETKLELDRRAIQNRIVKIKKDLKEMAKTRQVARDNRKQKSVKTVALVGYTNAGKSTLLNCLLARQDANPNKQVLEKNMLFSTLDTSARKIKISNNKEFVLIDTVGFISKLPYNLVEAFNSTFSDIKSADLLLHVIDISDENYLTKYVAVVDLIEDLEITDIPQILVVNKCDIDQDPKPFPIDTDNVVLISAKEGHNIEDLLLMIEDTIFTDLIIETFIIPYSKGQIYSKIISISEVIQEKHLDKYIELTVQIDKVEAEKLSQYKKDSLVN